MHEEVLHATTQIVSAYLTRNSVQVAQVAPLVGDVAKALEMATQAAVEVSEPPVAEIIAAQRPHRDDLVHEDHVVCAICGFVGRTLTRHLKAIHQTSPEQYRMQHGLPYDFPLTAPDYTAVRSRLAKEFGLGHWR